MHSGSFRFICRTVASYERDAGCSSSRLAVQITGSGLA